MKTVRSAENRARIRIKYTFKRLVPGSDLSIRRLPVMSAISAKPGPTIWLTACAHGDEVCGMVVVQEIFRLARKNLRCGSIHAFPLMNPFGFENATRKISVSQEDLNRCYPGDAGGTLGQRVANIVLTTIVDTSPALVLDLHTDWKRSIPYTVIDANPGPEFHSIYDKTLSFAASTGLACIQEQEAIAGTLSYNLLLKRIPALTLELGEPYVINEKNVRSGVEAIWNILSDLGLFDSSTSTNQADTSLNDSDRLFTYFDYPRSTVSGIIRFLAEPGKPIKSGQPFARIVNAFGKHLETVHALHDGIVLGHSDSSVVFPGMPIMAFGVRSSALLPPVHKF